MFKILLRDICGTIHAVLKKSVTFLMEPLSIHIESLRTTQNSMESEGEPHKVYMESFMSQRYLTLLLRVNTCS